MNWAKINHYADCGLQVANRIGVKNILFFGLFSSAVALNWWIGDGQKKYYGFHVFKRVEPTKTIYEVPY